MRRHRAERNELKPAAGSTSRECPDLGNAEMPAEEPHLHVVKGVRPESKVLSRVKNDLLRWGVVV